MIGEIKSTESFNILVLKSVGFYWLVKEILSHWYLSFLVHMFLPRRNDHRVDLFLFAFARAKSFALSPPHLPNVQMPHFSSSAHGEGSNLCCFGLDSHCSHLNYFHFLVFTVDTDIYSRNLLYILTTCSFNYSNI